MSMITNYKEAFDAIDDIGAFKESSIRIILHALGYVDDRPSKDKIQRLREQYEKTYNYADLIKKYRLDEDGTWGVEGEDPNCDLGGSHIPPVLGTFTGKLEDVLNHVVTLSGFWTWGGGGTIKKITVTQVKKS